MKMVYVEWIDSMNSHGWVSAKESQGNVPCVIRSAGFLLHESDDCIILALSYDKPNDNVNSAIAIPRFAITKMRRVK